MSVAPPRVEEPAPHLRLPTIEGEPFDLLERRGQTVLVSFLRHAG